MSSTEHKQEHPVPEQGKEEPNVYPVPERSRRALLHLLESAGKVIMGYYNSKNFEVESKSDDSPVTTADKASNDLIISFCTSFI